MVSYLGRQRPRILHTHLVHADVYGQLAGTMARVPLRLSTKHGFNEFREGRFFGLADRSVGSLAHVHIAISEGLAQYLAETEGFDEEGFEIVHYGIAAEDGVRPYEGTEPRLLCVGRLIPIKGHLVLLRALAQARSRVPGLELEVAGRGPLEPALRELARELGIEDAVRFLGFVSPVQAALEQAAVVVVPSLGEGFGMVALEAMERARPVIASAVGGLPEIVEDGKTGIVVEPGDADALAEAIVALAGRPRPRGGDGARRARARARRVHAGAQRGADRGALPGCARIRRRVARRAALGRAPRATRSRTRPGARAGSPTARGSAPTRRRPRRRGCCRREAGSRARRSTSARGRGRRRASA